MDIKARMEALRRERQEIEARLTVQAADIAEREELAREEEATEAARLKERALTIELAVEAVQERLGEDARVTDVAIDGRPDWYVIAHNERAFQTWQRAVNSTKKVDRQDTARTYAMAVVEVWNGLAVGEPSAPLIDYGGTKTTPGDALRRHLQANAAQVTPLVNEAGRLAGLYAIDRKSGG